MLYLERKIDTFLIHWKETKNKSPLIVKGARTSRKNRIHPSGLPANNMTALFISIS